MGYDFRTVSPADFEEITRDLLQAEWKTPIESFRKGRDGGIDLRAFVSRALPATIQCKHFVDSGFSKLVSHLRKEELPKLAILKPKRYVLSTSVPLSPANKAELVLLLSPYVLSAADILGAGDLNAALARHPTVERRHHKLWLTGIDVLQRLLHADVFQQTSIEMDSIRRRIGLYVPNASTERAAKILDKKHYCIIAGIPGVGKTSLAEFLIGRHCADGWEPVVVTGDVKEALRVLRDDVKQIIYYDDFLGQTALDEKLGKNEEKQIARLIDVAVTSPDKRFILTTREYILNQAKTKYEVLNRSEFSTGEATVLISDYDRPTKAKLLYNHLWFHGVDLAKIRAIIETKTHHKIIAHEHFLPRIIEWMTQKTRLEQVPDKGYPAAFVEMLDHPNQVWQHAYDSQIGVRERTLLIALSTLSHSVSIPELHRMHLAFAKAYCQDRFSQESTEAAIRTLDGSFVLTSRGRDGPLVALHNPSVRDFLNTVLGRRDVFESVIGSLCYLQQYERMSDLFHKHEELGPLLDLAVDRMVELAANSPTRWIPFGGQWTSWPTSQATQVANALARRKLVLTSSECQTLDALIDSSAKTTSELTGLLSALGPLAAPEDLSRIVAKYEDRIVNSIHDTDDLEAVIGIEDLLPERERTFTRLADCATSILEGNCDNLHEIAQTRTDAEDLKSKVSQICETLAIAEYPYIDRIDNYLEELRGPDEDSEYESYRDQGIDARSQEDDVDDLFETLDTEKSDDPA